jgi:hypothetical protein
MPNSEYTCEQPESIDFVDQILYDQIARTAPRDDIILVRRIGNKLQPTSYLNPKMDAVTESLESYSADVLKKDLVGIDYTINRTRVKPGRSQRPHIWHIDTVSDPIMVVSNVIPTEFVIAGEPGKNSDRQRNQMLRNLKRSNEYFDLVDPAIESGLLQIYQPKPYEAVVMRKGTIHRSAHNLGLTAVSRTFIRARLYTK